MALTKVDYVNGTTVIMAENLNAIQDEIIANGNAIGTQATAIQNLGTNKADVTALNAEASARAEADTAIDGELDELKSSLSETVITTPKSKNLLDYTKTLANKYLNPNGNMEDLNGRYVTDYIPVIQGKYVVAGYIGNMSGAYTKLGYAAICLYDKDKNVVSGGDYNKNKFLVNNSNIAYVRLTIGNGIIATSFGMVEQTDDGEISSFTFYIGEEGRELATDIIVREKKLGYMQAKGNLADGQSLTLPFHNVKNNNVLTFVGNITTFSKLKIGKETTTYITIDDTNVVITNDQGTFTKAHGLTIQDDIQVVIENETAITASLIRISSSGNTYEVDGTYAFLMDDGSAYAVSDGSTLTDCILSWTSRNINKPIWLFGDSYFSWYQVRWTYYLAQDGFTDSCMLNGYAGEASFNGFNALMNLLKIRVPQYIVWCLGMNNPDGTAVSPEWNRVYNSLVNLQKKYGFELILATIPSTSKMNNSYKNAIVRNSGYRYIDFSKAVDPDEDGTWFEGTEDTNHPTVRGAKILYHQVLADFPELTSL